MSSFKKVFALVLTFALVAALLPATKASAAAKLSSKAESIYVGETVTLNLTGVADVKWTTSNKKIATVKDGVVKGVKAGKATITATDKATKKKYTCKVTVNKLAEFDFNEESLWYFGGGDTFALSGNLPDGVTCKLDGETLNNPWRPGNWVFLRDFNETLTEGEHNLVLSKRGYKDYTWKFEFEQRSFEDGIWFCDPWVKDAILYVCLNPELEGKVKVTVDGKNVEPYEQFVNSDPAYVMWIDASGLSAGEHTLELSGDGIKNAKKTFTK